MPVNPGLCFLILVLLTSGAAVPQSSRQGLDCSKLPDGRYPHPLKLCSPYYFTCEEGFAIWGDACEEGLIFDPDNTTCLDKAEVAECNVTETSTASTTPVLKLKSAINCSALPDGIYEDPRMKCSPYFFTCLNEVLSRDICPKSQRFNAKVKACDEPENLPDCESVVTTSTSTASTTTTTRLPLPDISVDCEALGDGLYENPEEPCSRFYISCAARISRVMFCPTPVLRFDVMSQSCLVPKYVKWCGGTPTTRTPPTAVPDFDCENKTDGFYPNPEHACSMLYFLCTDEVSEAKECATGQAYDVHLKQCLVPRFVDACQIGGSNASTSAPIDLGSFNCAERDDGNYANPVKACSALFFACSGGQISSNTCNPPTLRYDATVNRCQEPALIVACGGSSTAPPSTTTTAELPASTFDCFAKPTGFYNDPEEPCNFLYYACNGGSSWRMQCPPGLFFDADTGNCGYKWEIVACGGSPPTPWSNSTATRTTVSESSKTTTTTKEAATSTTEVSASTVSSEAVTTTTEGLSSTTTTEALSSPTTTTAEVVTTTTATAAPTTTTSEATTTATKATTTTTKATTTTTKATTTTTKATTTTTKATTTTTKATTTTTKATTTTTQPTTTTTLATTSTTPTEATTTTTKGTTTTPKEVPTTTTTPSTVKVEPTTTTPPVFDCLGRPDGFYEDITNPCSSVFYICEKGNLFRKECFEYLKFDVLDGECKPEPEVEWCI